MKTKHSLSALQKHSPGQLGRAGAVLLPLVPPEGRLRRVLVDVGPQRHHLWLQVHHPRLIERPRLVAEVGTPRALPCGPEWGEEVEMWRRGG